MAMWLAFALVACEYTYFTTAAEEQHNPVLLLNPFAPFPIEKETYFPISNKKE